MEFREFETPEGGIDGLELDAVAHFENTYSGAKWDEQCQIAGSPTRDDREAIEITSIRIGSGRLERHEFSVLWKLVERLEDRGFDVDVGALDRATQQ